jgi:hypothetical protein
MAVTSARDIAAEMKLTRAGHWSVAKTYREHRAAGIPGNNA